MFTGRLCGGTRVTSAPSRRRARPSGWMNPAMMRSSVVLPHPDGPSSVTNSPLADVQRDVVERRDVRRSGA